MRQIYKYTGRGRRKSSTCVVIVQADRLSIARVLIRQELKNNGIEEHDGKLEVVSGGLPLCITTGD